MEILKKYWKYIVAGFGGLFLYFTWSKKQSAEALLLNQDTKQQLLDKDKQINQDKAVLDVEAEKRKQLEDSANKQKKDVSNEELTNFFNDPSNK